MTAFKRLNPVSFLTLVAVIVIYVAVRLWGLTKSCLWFDEIFSVHAAEHAWNELCRFVALDLIHPPLFYVLLKVWIAIGGEGLLWLRLLPVALSIVAVVPFVLLCNELKIAFWPRTLALFLLATNGSLIKYSQEVRMYSLLMCLSLFSMWLFVRFLNRSVGIFALTIVNLLMVYTHYFGWLVIAAQVVAVAFWKRDKAIKMAAMIGAVFVGFLPWLVAVRNAAAAGSSLGQNIGWMDRPSFNVLAQTVLDLIEPFYYQASSIALASDYRVSVPLSLIVAMILAVRFSAGFGETGEAKDRNKVLLALICVPILFALIASWLLPYSIWGTRHLIVVFVSFTLLISVALASVETGWLRTGALTLVILFTGFAGFRYALTPAAAHSWCNWEPQAVQAVHTSPATVYVLEDLPAYHVWYALRKMDTTVVAKIKNVPGVAEDTAYFLPRGFDEVRTIEFSELQENRFWLGYRAASIDKTQQPLKTFIDAGYRVISRNVLDAQQEQTIFLLLEKGS